MTNADFQSLPLAGPPSTAPRDTIIVSEPDPKSERFQRRSAAAKKGWVTRRQRLNLALRPNPPIITGGHSHTFWRDDPLDDVEPPTSDAGMWVVLILLLAVAAWIVLHMGFGVV